MKWHVCFAFHNQLILITSIFNFIYSRLEAISKSTNISGCMVYYTAQTHPDGRLYEGLRTRVV
jgi:hypothetical protein